MESDSTAGGGGNPQNLDAFLNYVEERQQLYQDRLAEAVAIPSVSAELDEHLVDIERMLAWTVSHI